MLPKLKRLQGKDFSGLKTRIVYRGACFDIACAHAQETKYACVISKKRIKRAVDRNKAKRKVYSVLEKISLPSPFYVIVYPTKSILTTPLKVLEEDFLKAFATL